MPNHKKSKEDASRGISITLPNSVIDAIDNYSSNRSAAVAEAIELLVKIKALTTREGLETKRNQLLTEIEEREAELRIIDDKIKLLDLAEAEVKVKVEPINKIRESKDYQEAIQKLGNQFAYTKITGVDTEKNKKRWGAPYAEKFAVPLETIVIDADVVANGLYNNPDWVNKQRNRAY